jgi:hypothetical protein
MSCGVVRLARGSIMIPTTTLAAVAIFVTTAGNVMGQAWVPPRGEGSVSFSYQRNEHVGVFKSDGSLTQGGFSVNMSLFVEADYSLTDRLSFTAGLPYVFSKYTDSRPPPPPVPYLPIDQCHCWQSAWQDFGFTARYNLLSGSFALTPSISVGTPSNNYNYVGEAVVGRNLQELRVGIDVGKRLDAISRKLSVQGRYSYAFVERILDIPNNRSNAAAELAYLLKRHLAIQGFAGWQRTHGGLHNKYILSGAASPDELMQFHRLLRENSVRMGGGLSYSFRKVDLFASYTAFLQGTDTHSLRTFTVGFSVPFRLPGSGR